MMHNRQQRRWRLFGLIATVAIFIAACTPLSGGTEIETLATDSSIIVSSSDQADVSVSVIDQQIVLDIHSDSGIGSVDVSGLAGPEVVLLQLHVSGLEQFRFLYGSTEVEASVSSRGSPVVMQSVTQQGGEAEPIDEESPYWLGIELVVGNGDPVVSIPMEDGYFQVTPPIDFAYARPSSFTLSWIDFYR
jgi:hypothetical protein